MNMMEDDGRRPRLDEVDRLLPADSRAEGNRGISVRQGSLTAAGTRAPPRLRQMLFFATYILYYAANTLMGPLLPSSKQLNLLP